MKLIDEKALDLFRTPGPCEACGRFCHRREAAHVFSKGAGRVDHPLNLVGLCPVSVAGCHHKSHYGDGLGRDDLLAIVAKREGVTAELCEAFVYAVRLAPKGSSADTILVAVHQESRRAALPHHPRCEERGVLPGVAPRPSPRRGKGRVATPKVRRGKLRRDAG